MLLFVITYFLMIFKTISTIYAILFKEYFEDLDLQEDSLTDILCESDEEEQNWLASEQIDIMWSGSVMYLPTIDEETDMEVLIEASFNEYLVANDVFNDPTPVRLKYLSKSEQLRNDIQNLQNTIDNLLEELEQFSKSRN